MRHQRFFRNSIAIIALSFIALLLSPSFDVRRDGGVLAVDTTTQMSTPTTAPPSARQPPGAAWERLPVCRWCHCDVRQRVVACLGDSSGGQQQQQKAWPRLLRLPAWAREFRAFNLSGMHELPHFADAPALRRLRVEQCNALRAVHPLSFVPLAGVEAVHFVANGALEWLPPGLFRPLANRLRVLDLSGNRFKDVTFLLASLPEGVMLDRLNLGENPFFVAGGRTQDASGRKRFGALAKRLYLGGTRLAAINATGITFDGVTHDDEGKSMFFLPFSDDFWRRLEVLDLGDNPKLRVDASALARFARLRALRLAGGTLPAELLAWVQSRENGVRHLDIAGARIRASTTFAFPFEALGDDADEAWRKRRAWTFCAPSLEWLDISAVRVAAGVDDDESDEKGRRFDSMATSMDDADDKTGSASMNHERLPRLTTKPFVSQRPHTREPQSRRNDDAGKGAIESIRLNTFCRVKWLYADRNRIREAHVEGNELLTLSLADNQLERFPLLHNPPTTTTATQQPKRVFKNLVSLTLAGNRLATVPEELVVVFPALRTLSLAGNRLATLTLSVPTQADGGELRALNVSANALTRLELIGDGALRALSTLDLSGNRLARFSLWAMRWLPALEHLYLARNAGVQFQPLNADDDDADKIEYSVTYPDGVVENEAEDAGGGYEKPTFVVSTKLAAIAGDGGGRKRLSQSTASDESQRNLEQKQQQNTLLEVDLSECGLSAQPDLARFTRLRILSLAGNRLARIDGRLLPAAGVSHLDVHGNAIWSVGNLSAAQVQALQELNLARNPLRCHCPLQPDLLPMLKQQPNVYDDDEYFCVEKTSGWQFPLSMQLFSAQDMLDCVLEWEREESGGGNGEGGGRQSAENVSSIAAFILLAVLAVFGGALLSIFLVVVAWRNLGDRATTADAEDANGEQHAWRNNICQCAAFPTGGGGRRGWRRRRRTSSVRYNKIGADEGDADDVLEPSREWEEFYWDARTPMPPCVDV